MEQLGRSLAKVSWEDPTSGQIRDYVLAEGASITIGRGEDNTISIPDRRVSRRHAAIHYMHGVFLVSDLGSSNGVFVNDERVVEPYPLIDGDTIRLFVPTMQFAAVLEDTPVEADFPVLEVTAGAEQGTEIIIDNPVVTFGRATNNATWDIKLRDQAVSRPHARLEVVEGVWYLTDLGSVNGTFVNGHPVHQSIVMQDGMVIIMGETQMVFRQHR